MQTVCSTPTDNVGYIWTSDLDQTAEVGEMETEEPYVRVSLAGYMLRYFASLVSADAANTVERYEHIWQSGSPWPPYIYESGAPLLGDNHPVLKSLASVLAP